ncbi:MAG TPA: hypothetical protein VFH17_01040 [Coriobacteriia bacterium]|nr:hypothetical protein [Coriobacteriia bacterium]
MRAFITQTNFSAGELSPRLLGRSDIERYQNGVRTLANALPLIHGGAIRRYGTRFVAPAKAGSSAYRLIRFVHSREVSYVLEFGHQYMRVFRAGAQIMSGAVPYEIATPYTAAMLPAVDFAQGADTMFLVHRDVPVHRLRRFADAAWNLAPAPWIVAPFEEHGHIGSMSLTLSAASVGTGRTATAGSARFLASDVGRQITAGPGIATITAFGSATSVTITILVAFESTSIAGGQWRIEGSPQTTLTPSATGPRGAAVTLTAAVDAWRNPEDVGKMVRLNGGSARITGWTSATIVAARIERVLASAIAAPAGAWTMESDVWSAEHGYPAAVTFHEQRLLLGGSPRYPQTIWGSAPNESLNFMLGPADDDAFAFELATDQINPIAFLVPLAPLVALTYGGELSIAGSTDRPLNPTNVSVRSHTAHGCAIVKPVRVGGEVLFVQRGGRRVRALVHDDSGVAYHTEDMSLLAEHITLPQVVALEYQAEPDPFLWALRSDGVLLSCAIDRRLPVTGWARHHTDGAVLSIAVIPEGDTEQLWAVVRRTVGSVAVHYIERFDPAVLADCAITATVPGGAVTWGGLGHLEGRTVHVVADESLYPPQTVTAGSITLPRAATAVMIGLPYTTTIELLTPEIQGPGTAQGSHMRTHELTLRVHDTSGAEVNSIEAIHRQFGAGALDTPQPRVTDDVRVNLLGWERGASPVKIEQRNPLRFHIQAAIRRFTWNDG